VRRSRGRRLPKEVVDALRNDPDLLWVAQQVAALAEQPGTSGRRRRWLIVAGAAVTVAAATVAVAALPLVSDHAPRITDQALAAVGSDRVLHAEVARTVADDRTVDLATGKQTPTLLTVESWFDEQSRRLHVIERRNQGVVAETVGRAQRVASTTTPRLDPALELFLTGYREALRQGRVRDLGNAVVDERTVRWLALVGVHPTGERVAVDPGTFAPLLIQEPDGTRWIVTRLASVPLAAAEFRLSRRIPLAPSVGGVVSHRRSSPAQARKLLGLPVLGVGRPGSELRLESLEVESLSSGFARNSHRRPLRSTGVSLTYRLSEGGAVGIREARRPLPAYAFSGGLTFSFDPIPGAKTMQLTTIGGAWLGQLRTHRLYVTITGPDPATVIDAARDLRPITE
jgi:hypothetical protein